MQIQVSQTALTSEIMVIGQRFKEIGGSETTEIFYSEVAMKCHMSCITSDDIMAFAKNILKFPKSEISILNMCPAIT
jgi:hypothetical protein